MSIKPEVKKRLDEAVKHELTASNMYLNLAIQMQGVGYFGTQKYFESEASTEREHAKKITDYVNDMGGVSSILGVDSQMDKVTTLKDAFDIAMEAESDLLKFYVELYEEMEDEMKDCVTAQFLLQFIEIQRKSVGEVRDILSMIDRAGKNEAALLIVDSKLDK